MRPSNESLISDYMRDLVVDIRCATRDGHHDYADKCQRELDTLKLARRIVVDQYGVPHTA